MAKFKSTELREVSENILKCPNCEKIFASDSYIYTKYNKCPHCNYNFETKTIEDGQKMESAESKEWFFEYLNKRFSHDVFLSPDAMNDQLNLIGIGFNNVMKIAYPKPTEQQSRKYGRKIVQDLFDRRNAIAHQVDRKHESAERNDIDRAFVEQCITDIELIVSTIHNIAENR
jgi:uncharacterized C2H2 Zn-finger protein